MSVEQILEELPKLTLEERRRIFELLAQLESQNSQTLTPEESAAIDEAIRSLEAGKGVPASEVRQRFAAKWSR
jgi:type IV secretory pathway VirB4 component